jgi:hypothetical protein
MPVWLLGTSLYLEDSSEKYGRSQTISGLDAFQGLRSLTVGSSFRGDVAQTVNGQRQQDTRYLIDVTELKTVKNQFLGDVEVYVIKEHRSQGSAYWSDKITYVSSKYAAPIYSRRTDNQGKVRECDLVGLQPR